VATGLLGFVLKLYRASESNYLFDGASLVLYLCALVVYLTNIVTGLRLASARAYDGLQAGRSVPGAGLLGADAVPVGREDALRVLSASNTICALVLVGVLVLQAGQWYAERKEGEEAERARRERAAKVKAVGGLAGKKKA
jgi:cytochrome bd-type quinol oxidase subunit 2